MKLKKEIATLLLASTLLAAPLTACNTAQNGGDDIDNSTTENTTLETVINDGEYDPATYMRYTPNSDGKSYSVCPIGLPKVMKELVIPGEYKGLPVTKIDGKCLEDSSIETIIISEGIQEILIGFKYCRDIKNIYIPSSVIYITDGAFNGRPTMGGMPGSIKTNVIENIVVAEGDVVQLDAAGETGNDQLALGNDGNTVGNAPQLLQLRGNDDNGHALLSV